MAVNKTKEHLMQMQIESHETAAWADIQETKPISNVTVPSERQVRNAKEWVDSNQK